MVEKSVVTNKRKNKSSKPKKKNNNEHKEDNDDGKDKPNNEPNNGDDGLLVQAYNHTGEEYILTLKYIETNNSYHIMDQWGIFRNNSSLILKEDSNNAKKNNKKGKKGKKKVKKVNIANEAIVALWVFCSWKPSHGKDDNDDGSLELVMVHYFEGEATHAVVAFKANEELLMRPSKKRNKNMRLCYAAEEPNGVAAIELEIAAVMAGEAGV
uniref:Uncharacterized protein n=1 Tax=Oryza punctata TaxID=4537 RepID=A0A0E0L020_ORYPU